MSHVSNIERAKVSCTVPKSENIIFIGSELHYDSFWWKMMFIAPCYKIIKDPSKFRKPDKLTVAYVDIEYNYMEKLAIEGIKSLSQLKEVDVEFKKITSAQSTIDIFSANRDSINFKMLSLCLMAFIQALR